MDRKPGRITVETLPVGQMAANCYLLIDQVSGEALIIDPGDDPEYIIEQIEKHKATPKIIMATHGHFDHIMGARAIQVAYNLPFYIHAAAVFFGVDDEQASNSGIFDIRFDAAAKWQSQYQK